LKLTEIFTMMKMNANMIWQNGSIKQIWIKCNPIHKQSNTI
jgi:hypothetical protein